MKILNKYHSFDIQSSKINNIWIRRHLNKYHYSIKNYTNFTNHIIKKYFGRKYKYTGGWDDIVCVYRTTIYISKIDYTRKFKATYQKINNRLSVNGYFLNFEIK